jgi:single-strand DNA-binding protein
MELCNISLVGNLTRDPELRQAGESQVCKFSVAINKQKRGGEKKTIYMNVQVWGKAAENCSNYLQKGQQVAVTGEIDEESYTNHDGVEVRKLFVAANKVSFGRSPGQQDGSTSQQPRQAPKAQQSERYEEPQYLPEDDMPF